MRSKAYLRVRSYVRSLKVLTDELVPLVEAFLCKEPYINAYAIWDLHYLRHRSKFLVSIEDGKLTGLLLDYFGHNDVHFIWLWGEEEVIEELLDSPLPSKMIFHVPPGLESLIERKFPISAKYPVDFLLLKKGCEQLHLRHEIKPLSLGDAYLLASLRREKPSEKEIGNAESLLKEQQFYGIFSDSKLVSAACVQVKLPEIWILGGFYTKPEYRNRGYATSLASFLVEKALKETDHIGLHVRADNRPAKRVYEKVGFKVYKKMCWLDHNTGLMP